MKALLKKLFIWLLKSGWMYINFIALIAIYVVNKEQLGVEVIAGLWIFFLIAIYGYKWFVKDWCGCKKEK